MLKQIINIMIIAFLILPSIAFSESRTITKEKSYGCTSKEGFDKLNKMHASGDHAAFKKVLTSALFAGYCAIFHKGDEIYVVDTEIFSGLTKVRFAGDATEYWTFIENIQP